jgi:hypothetical protein
MVSWLRVGPTTKPSHQEAIPDNTNANPASAGSFNPSADSYFMPDALDGHLAQLRTAKNQKAGITERSS